MSGRFEAGALGGEESRLETGRRGAGLGWIGQRFLLFRVSRAECCFAFEEVFQLQSTWEAIDRSLCFCRCARVGGQTLLLVAWRSERARGGSGS